MRLVIARCSGRLEGPAECPSAHRGGCSWSRSMGRCRCTPTGRLYSFQASAITLRFAAACPLLRLRVTREPASIIELQSEGGPAS
jgi:hypothetical protein